jgi:hypothetical protein
MSTAEKSGCACNGAPSFGRQSFLVGATNNHGWRMKLAPILAGSGGTGLGDRGRACATQSYDSTAQRDENITSSYRGRVRLARAPSAAVPMRKQSKGTPGKKPPVPSLKARGGRGLASLLVPLDHLLARLHDNKSELLMALVYILPPSTGLSRIACTP